MAPCPACAARGPRPRAGGMVPFPRPAGDRHRHRGQLTNSVPDGAWAGSGQVRRHFLPGAPVGCQVTSAKAATLRDRCLIVTVGAAAGEKGDAGDRNRLRRGACGRLRRDRQCRARDRPSPGTATPARWSRGYRGDRIGRRPARGSARFPLLRGRESRYRQPGPAGGTRSRTLADAGGRQRAGSS